MSLKECVFYEKLKNNEVKCTACNHYCVIKSMNSGICRVRKNIEGKLYGLVYGKIICENIDPIEKKPLYHFLPKTETYSIGTVGCNFKCSFCQNYDISQYPDLHKKIVGKTITPQKIVNQALNNGCASISYTYNEPTIFIEFVIDTAKLAHKKGLKNVLVSNGYMSKEAITKLAPVIDAINIDLKSFNDDFYKKLCKAKLNPVLESIKLFKKLKVWVEVTTLIIPKENDDLNEIKKIAKFLSSIDEKMPFHLSRFFPHYNLKNKKLTSSDILKKAYAVSKKYLKNVYIGNYSFKNSTICEGCKKEVIIRGLNGVENKLIKNACPYCKNKIKGVFE